MKKEAKNKKTMPPGPDTAPALVRMEWDGPQGLEVYTMPLKNALALTGAIIHRFPSITLYSYDYGKNNGLYSRNFAGDLITDRAQGAENNS